jgi:hypothetical protein
MNDTLITFSDDEIATFVDGNADGELARKIDAAMQNDPNFAAHINTLQAPVRAIKDALDLDVIDAPNMPQDMLIQDGWSMSRIAMPIAIAASFALGMIAMNLLQRDPDWVDQVASYQALYVADTLAGETQNADTTQSVFFQAQASVGFDLTGAPEFPGMVFKRAQMLAVDNRPLIQIAYLADDGTPFALCIIQVDQDDRPIENTMPHDLAASSWVSDGVGYLLIGGSDAMRVSDLAKGLTDTI